MMKSLALAALIAVLVGAAAGVGLCLIALDHNPQGEFYSAELGGYQWGALAPLFLISSLFVGAAAFVPVACLFMVRRRFMPLRKTGTS